MGPSWHYMPSASASRISGGLKDRDSGQALWLLEVTTTLLTLAPASPFAFLSWSQFLGQLPRCLQSQVLQTL